MTKTIAVNIWIQILYVLLFAACCLPAAKGFADELVGPKWYATAFVSVIIVVTHCCVGWGEVNKSNKPIVVALLLVGMAECLYVLVDEVLLSNICLVGATGTFDNPAGLALFVCLCVPFAGLFTSKRREWLWRMVGILVICVLTTSLLATKSRTGLMTLGLMFVMLLLCGKSKVLKGLLVKVATCILVMIVIGVYVFKQKEDSTDGRRFILERTWELICERPVVGHGGGGFNKEYMLRQADYFKDNPDSKCSVLADDVRHPLNEFAKVWVEYGVIGPVLLLSLMAIPAFLLWRKDDKLCRSLLMSLMIIFVFSCFSYPFNYPVTWVLLAWSYMKILSLLEKKLESNVVKNFVRGAFLAASVLSALTLTKEFQYEHKWYRASQYALHGRFAEVASVYKELYGHYDANPYFLYNYTAELYHAGLFEDALNIAKECRGYWPSYNLELLSGDICRRMCKNDNAIMHYITAGHMCPSRFAPLEGLYYTYIAKGDTANAAEMSQVIASKSMKVVSQDALRIKAETRRYK